MAWTTDQILALAPDASAAKSGKDLAAPRKWTALGQDAQSAWGLCQGSGKDPYQARIDLAEPAFKCSCPSRKFPCKHTLGLFLIFAEQPKAMTETLRPPWVEEWLTSRQARAEKKAEKHDDEFSLSAEPEVQQKRISAQEKTARAREQKVAAGLIDLDLFLRDIVRQGLAAIQPKPGAFWEAPAARLIDAQAPGLARILHELSAIPASGAGWQQRMLERLGRLHLIVQGYKRIDTCPPETQADLRTLIGFTTPQEDVLAGPSIQDDWMILGQRVNEEDRLRVQRTWFWSGAHKRAALVLQFAHGNQPLDVSLTPGTKIDAELCYFPSAYPQRALIKNRFGSGKALKKITGYPTIADALAACANALNSFPWLENFPMPLESVVPILHGEKWNLRDSSGSLLPISTQRGEGWRLAAISGGHPIQLFGEWNGEKLLPLTAWADDRSIPCA